MKQKTPESVVLASKIQRLRLSLNMHQGEFARLVGVSQQTISDWEQGRRLRQMMIAMRVLRLLEGTRSR